MLRFGSGYGLGAGSSQVRALQRRLRALGQRPGPVDGLYGPRTEAAVERFQRTHGLAVDGVVGPRTRGALRAARTLAGGAGGGGSQRVRAIQRRLRRVGARPGPVDGVYGRLTERAVKRFQGAQGLDVDGVVGRRTAARLRSSDVAARQAHRARRQASRPHPRPQSPIAVQPGPARRHGGDAFPAAAVALAGWLAAMALIILRLWGHTRRRPAGAGMVAKRAGDAARAPPHRAQGGGGSPGGRSGRVTVAPNGAGNGDGDGAPVFGYVGLRDAEALDADEFRACTEAIDDACERLGLRLVQLVRERVSHNPRQRPGLDYALGRISDAEAHGLVVSRLAHLGRSPDELGEVIAWFWQSDARLVATDQQLDTGTESGRQTARTVAYIRQLERDGLADPLDLEGARPLRARK